MIQMTRCSCYSVDFLSTLFQLTGPDRQIIAACRVVSVERIRYEKRAEQ
jgi:hypothetical protein